MLLRQKTFEFYEMTNCKINDAKNIYCFKKCFIILKFYAKTVRILIFRCIFARTNRCKYLLS